MIRSSFAGRVIAEDLAVEGNLFMDDATFVIVDLRHAKVGSVLDLHGTVATVLNLSGAVAGEFLFGGMGWRCADGSALVGVADGASVTGSNATPVHWPLGDPAWRNT